jgi:triosephosphate isomerase
VGGNWKCNGTVSSVDALVAGLNKGTVPSNIDVVVAPVFIHLKQVLDSIKPPFQVAAQNCWNKGAGAYTGEVTADMLADLGVPWVITGHSERRDYNKETNEFVAEKTKYAIDAGRKVIVCVGESLPQREEGKLWDHLDAQMRAIKNAVPEASWANLVVAYEPIWAIGTGKVATPKQAQVGLLASSRLDFANIKPKNACGSFGVCMRFENCVLYFSAAQIWNPFRGTCLYLGPSSRQRSVLEDKEFSSHRNGILIEM